MSSRPLPSEEDVEKVFEYEDEIDNEPPASSEAVEENKRTTGQYSSVHSAAFKDLLLKPELLRALSDCGFEHPSEVQHECIPHVIMGHDVICQAKSGMGKTAVFVLAVLQQIIPLNSQVSTLVLCHARELAFQIKAEFVRFCKFLPDLRVEVFYGGVPPYKHKELLKNPSTCPHIVIGTPGRTLQLANEKSLVLSHVKHFVLDECDKMLESLDMRRDVQDIFRKTPHVKQVMMFSATLSTEIRPICKKFMHNPIDVFIDEGSKLTLHGLQQYYLELDESKKNQKLVDLLDNLDFNQLVIFVRSVGRANELNKVLEGCNFPSTCIHSGMKQEERIERYRKFRDFQKRIMVATNLLGRGIDIERVNVVINYDMSENSDTYLHRVGRAGRFGTKGLAVSFISSKEDASVLNSVQDQFVVSVSPLPEKIDPASYTTS